MKGLTAALTPPLPNENSTMLTTMPAVVTPSRASAAGIDVNKRIKAPKNTILERDQSRMYGSPAFGQDLHGRKKYRSEATKPRVCDDCSQYRGKV